MNRPTTWPRRALWWHLWVWALGALLVVWLTLIAVAWYTGFHEARKFSDGQLVSVARLWMAAPSPMPQLALKRPSGPDHEYLQNLAVIAWEDGRLVTDTHGMLPGLAHGALPTQGFATLKFQASGGVQLWRSYGTRFTEAERQWQVLVLMDQQQRHELGKDLAEHVAQPAVLVLPLIALVLWWTIRRGLRPLERLSREVAALDSAAGQRLDAEHRFREFASTVSAINTLVDTLQRRAQREREFASDVAHELRTPLAVIALQARAARSEPSGERLERLEQESLRAGRILAQLLDLARAHRDSHVDTAKSTEGADLGETAARLIAAHAPQGHDTGHELSLVRSGQAVRVPVTPLLLELALRNLIENALRHTPAGTQVEVEVWARPGAVGVSVSDDGQRVGAPHGSLPGSGLGLGLRLVERMAEEMGAAFERDTGEPPMTTRFSLRWSLAGR